MKIAVVLRGQPRSSQEAAALFDKFIRDRMPSNYEFKFFVHTSRRMSKMPVPDVDVSAQSELMLDKLYNQTALTLDETVSLIRPWRPVHFNIEDEAPFFEVCKNIVEDLANDVLFHQWWNYHIKLNNISEDDIWDAALIIPNQIDSRGHVHTKLYEPLLRNGYHNYEGNFYDLNSILSLIRFHYVFKQYYGFIQSYNVLKEYMSLPDTEYTPDLIWFTRLDSVHTLVDFKNPESDLTPADFFDSTLANITQAGNDSSSLTGKYPSGAIATQQLFIERNHAWIDDFNLFSTVELMERISHRKPAEFIIDAFKQRKHQLLNIIDSRISLQHTLWPAVFNDVIFIKATNSLNMLRSTVFREGFHDRIDPMDLTSDWQSIKKFFDLSDTYSYPKVVLTRQPTPDEIIKEYLFLSNN